MRSALPLLSLIGLFLAGSLFADRSTLDETKTRYALPLPEPPEIDGVIDLDGGESWNRAAGVAGRNWRVQYDENLEDFFRGGTYGDNDTEEPWDVNDLQFDIYVGMDQDNLYVAVRVFDDYIFTDSAEEESEDEQTWLDDGVELFIDGNNSNFAERNNTDPDVIDSGGQFVITANNARRDKEAGDPEFGAEAEWFAKTATRDDTGYDAEFRISWSILGDPKPGDIIGFTVGVNDDDDGDTAERQIVWVGSPHTEHTYGNLILGGRRYVAPMVSDAPTLDGVIGDNEYPNAMPNLVNGFTGVYNIPSGDDTWESDDHSFTWRVVFDREAIYVGCEVLDDQLVSDTAQAGSEDGQTWHDDSVEIFFDPDESDDEGRGMTPFEGQYVMTVNGAWRDNEANNPEFGENGDWYAVAKEGDGKYTIEFKVQRSALLDPEDGTVMGFNIAINDDDGSNRKAQLNWSGRPHSEFTYGQLVLGQEVSADPPSLSFESGTDGIVTISFEGNLLFANSVDGPWEPVPLVLPSPLKIDLNNPADPLTALIQSEAVLFVRAVRP